MVRGGQNKLTIDEVKKTAKNRGGKLISTEYKNIDSSLIFECSKGHRFKNTFNHIKHGKQWCPTCNKGSKSEEIARTTFEQLFGYKFIKYRPKWLKNSRGYQMELDGHCKELNVGLEYQGRQHFDLPLHNTNLDKRKKDDKLKRKLCADHNVKLFIITYKMEYKDFYKYIAKQAKKLNVELPSNFYQIKVDIYKAFIRNDRISELQDLLKPKHILVLSPKYLGSKENIDLECLVCGYKWTSQGNKYFNSRRVAGCDKCNRKKQGLKHKLNISALENFATKFNGKLLSNEYVQRNYFYKWQCFKGHIFYANFNNMKHRNEFCPKCEGRKLKGLNAGLRE
jgi:hypothetical protein